MGLAPEPPGRNSTTPLVHSPIRDGRRRAVVVVVLLLEIIIDVTDLGTVRDRHSVPSSQSVELRLPSLGAREINGPGYTAISAVASLGGLRTRLAGHGSIGRGDSFAAAAAAPPADASSRDGLATPSRLDRQCRHFVRFRIVQRLSHQQARLSNAFQACTNLVATRDIAADWWFR